MPCFLPHSRVHLILVFQHSVKPQTYDAHNPQARLEWAIVDLDVLYDSEINLTVSPLWDAGFRWKLGDEMNGLRCRAARRAQ